MNDEALGWVALRTDPEQHQATCDQCGWHTVLMVNRKRVVQLAKKHEDDCPRPYPPRNGAVMECGCWWYASPGSAVGETRADCPEHGRVSMVRANVDGPKPPDYRVWVPESET